MTQVKIYDLVKNYTALTELEINTLIKNEITAPPGTIVCAGVWNGGDIMALTLRNPSRRIIAIDSFEGLAEPSKEDLAEGAMTKGEMSIGGKEVFLNNFKQAKISPPEVYEFFINKKTLVTIDPGTIGMLWLDLDHYQPTKDCLEYFNKYLAKNAIIMTHDYGFIRCPGIEKACKEYKDKWIFEAGGIYKLINE